MFDSKSRYHQLRTYEVTDHRGRKVVVTPSAPASAEVELGTHLRAQGQRLDHLAAKYLNDPAGFWRICELNRVMWPDALAEAREVRIPRQRRSA